MIRSSSCPPWRPEPTSDPTEDRRSYTTPRDVTGTGGRRLLIIKAGKSHRFSITESEVPS
jgi:hypothetical protein